MPSPDSPPARVAVFATGGTIATTRVPGGDGERDERPVPMLSGRQLVAAVPGLDQTGVDLEVHDVLQVPSSFLTIGDIENLAGLIRARLAAGAAGAVVTQGTDTLEEAAFLLDLLVDGDAPVVVTGAMRGPDFAGADGPANILAAVRAAASAEARGLGCVVVLADQIHAARWVRKTHTTSLTAFASPSAGPVGHVSGGRILMHARPAPLPPLPSPRGEAARAVRVGLLTMALGDDGEFLRAARGRFDGLVIAAFGAGHVPDQLLPDLAELAGRVPLVLASRVGAGSIRASGYEFPGAAGNFRGRGLISAGLLDPLKARLLLHVLLAHGAGHEEIRQAFASFGG